MPAPDAHAPPSGARAAAALVGILALAAALRIAGLGFGLAPPSAGAVVHPLARPDEHIAWNIALGIYAGDPDPHFFQYPALWFYALAAADFALAGLGALAAGSREAVELAWLEDPRALIWVARGLAAALGTATVWLAYGLGATAFDRRVGLVAAFFAAAAYLHVRDSHFGVTDVPMVFLASAALLQALRIQSRGRARDYAHAGLLAGLATATKYTGVTVLAPIVVAHWLARPRRSPWLLAAALALAAGAFLAANPFALLAGSEFRSDLAKVASQAGQPWLGVDLGRGLWRHPGFSLWYGLGPPLLLASLAGWLPALRRAPRASLVLLAFAVAYFASVAGSPLVFVRYATPLVPVLCLSAAAGVVALAERLPRARRAAVLAGALVVALPSLRSAIDLDRLLQRTDSRVLAGRWLGEHLAPGARVLLVTHVFGDPAAFFAGRLAYDPYPWPPAAWAGRVPRPPELAFWRAPNDLDPRLAGWLADAELDAVVVAHSPLAAYGPGHPMRKRMRNFELAEEIEGVGHDPRMRFDLQDAFYVPFAGARHARRPGPNFSIYLPRPPGGGAARLEPPRSR